MLTKRNRVYIEDYLLSRERKVSSGIMCNFPTWFASRLSWDPISVTTVSLGCALSLQCRGTRPLDVLAWNIGTIMAPPYLTILFLSVKNAVDQKQILTFMVKLLLTRVPRQLNAETIVLNKWCYDSGYPDAKEWSWTLTLNHIKIKSK